MDEFSYTVECAEAVVPVREYAAQCVDVPRFLEYCKACPNYGRRWSCPPFDFDAAAFWGRYETLRLYARFLAPTGSRDGQAMLDALAREKRLFLDWLSGLERTHANSRALACGSCSRCEECTRAQNQACRHPELLRPSIESLGGDVMRTAERCFGRPLLWMQDGVAPDYMALVGGLLIPAGEQDA